MKNYLCCLFICLIFSCAKTKKSHSTADTFVPLDTISDISLLADRGRAIYKTPSGKCYDMFFVPDPADEIVEAAEDSIGTRSMLLRSASNQRCDSEVFDGKYRKEAKTSIYSGTLKRYSTLTRFLNTLQNDYFMAEEHDPEITTASLRVTEEKRYVRIARTYLYAYSKQADEDYHLIFGTTSDPATARYFNAEISGVPEDQSTSSYTKLLAVWDDFAEHIGGEKCGSGYIFFSEPQRVELSGCLFFDKEHYNENIGPARARPLSAWEIHPITKLKFY